MDKVHENKLLIVYFIVFLVIKMNPKEDTSLHLYSLDFIITITTKSCF